LLASDSAEVFSDFNLLLRNGDVTLLAPLRSVFKLELINLAEGCVEELDIDEELEETDGVDFPAEFELSETAEDVPEDKLAVGACVSTGTDKGEVLVVRLVVIVVGLDRGVVGGGGVLRV
jgi:hypothetical protein